jgi:hypothetical protein
MGSPPLFRFWPNHHVVWQLASRRTAKQEARQRTGVAVKAEAVATKAAQHRAVIFIVALERVFVVVSFVVRLW